MLEGIKGVSTYASQIDDTFIIVTGITLFLFIVTIGSMLYFAYKYSAKRHRAEDTQNIKHYTPIEIAWTVIPTILMMIIFYYGLESLRVQRTMPKDDNSMIVKVLAQRWSWSFEYENGKKTKELTIPVNSNIKLIMTAPENDVLHSFFVPAFRAKEDIVPGQITKLWFNANTKGKFDILCAEYCGTRHSYMRSFVNVVSKDEFKTFITPPLKEVPKTALDIFNENGCTSCHTLDGTPLVGPSFKDIFNKEVSVTTNGVKRVLKRDETYLRNAILEPNKDVVENFFPNMMPSFKGQIKDKDLDTVINYFKGIKAQPKKEEVKKLDGFELINNNGCLGCHSIDGSKIVGPSFKDIYKRKTKVVRGSKTVEVIADEFYLKNSILNPKADVVESYPNIMPTFKNVLTEQETDEIIKYLKTVK